jgi:hypothetical protein
MLYHNFPYGSGDDNPVVVSVTINFGRWSAVAECSTATSAKTASGVNVANVANLSSLMRLQPEAERKSLEAEATVLEAKAKFGRSSPLFSKKPQPIRGGMLLVLYRSASFYYGYAHQIKAN